MVMVHSSKGQVQVASQATDDPTHQEGLTSPGEGFTSCTGNEGKQTPCTTGTLLLDAAMCSPLVPVDGSSEHLCTLVAMPKTLTLQTQAGPGGSLALVS